MKFGMQKNNILKILGENNKNIKMRKIWGVVLVVVAYAPDYNPVLFSGL